MKHKLRKSYQCPSCRQLERPYMKKPFKVCKLEKNDINTIFVHCTNCNSLEIYEKEVINIDSIFNKTKK